MISASPDGTVTVNGQTLGRDDRERYFVSPHAVQRYQERVDRRASFERAVRAIEAGLQGRGPYPAIGRPLAIADRRERFVAIIAPADGAHGPWPVVMTIWAYGVCPILLKSKGGRMYGKKKYRWLNGAFVSRLTGTGA